MKQILFFITLLFSTLVFSQKDQTNKKKTPLSTDSAQTSTQNFDKATIDQYRIISIENDTTFVDTSLTIYKDYKWNYLRKDIFGLLPFANEGQTYTVLDYSYQKKSSFPEMGFRGKHFNYLQISDINYYSVATPLTDLYFKTVMQQGQNLDAFATINTSQNFNFSVAYKGLRSLGRYINQLSSAGNLRFTANYHTKNLRYNLKTHFTGQDLLNGENGGITNLSEFENGDPLFSNRERLEVYLRDAESFLKGNRYFIDHQFRINKSNSNNNLFLAHQFSYETKLFEYRQATIASTVQNTTVLRFGDSYVSSRLNDKTKFNNMYNKIGAVYTNQLLGTFHFFTEDFRSNSVYDRILILDNSEIPASLSQSIQTLGGRYKTKWTKWNGDFLIANSVSNQPMSTIEANLGFDYNEKYQFKFGYQLLSKVPDNTFQLYQSDFVHYNWFNNFNNVKINAISAEAVTPFVNLNFKAETINDFLYFSNDSQDNSQQLISPKQYQKTINYLSLKASNEIKWWKLALDNTVLFQQVVQDDNVLNVPQIVTRNSFYFTDYLFKKALYLQTGFTVNYFTEYYINDYNPVIAESFVQNQTKAGNFPLLDFFINARIRQTRIYFKAEHFNSSLTGYNYYTAPNYPYRDFIIRFGLEWNFFQ